jgi:RNA polymerase sigma-70 factor (ECF subfamily)
VVDLRPVPRVEERQRRWPRWLRLCRGLLLLVRGLQTSTVVRWGPRRAGCVEGDRILLSELADEELFQRFRQGERPAFEALLRRHRAPLFTFVLRVLGTGDRARAEDVVQDTFVRVIRGAHDWEQRARFSTWLFTIARNLCLDHMRREKHRQAESLDEPAGADDARPLSETIEGPQAGPERQTSNARVRPVITTAIEKLPAEQREVFVLREYSGVPFKEIAELTGVSENTVKSRMRYALEGLRKALTAAGIDGDLADDDAAHPRAVTGVR